MNIKASFFLENIWEFVQKSVTLHPHDDYIIQT